MEIMDGRTNAVQEPTAVGRDIAYQVADWGKTAANNLMAESRRANKDLFSTSRSYTCGMLRNATHSQEPDVFRLLGCLAAFLDSYRCFGTEHHSHLQGPILPETLSNYQPTSHMSEDPHQHCYGSMKPRWEPVSLLWTRVLYKVWNFSAILERLGFLASNSTEGATCLRFW
jgi:hypothetical protein